MTLKQTKAKGFTIVELLIVVVVIAILAAITIVAYNGIQNRARTSSAHSTEATLSKKIEAFNANTGAYPVTGTSLATQLNTNANSTESSISGSGIVILAANPDNTNGTNSVRVEFCTAPAGATGYRTTYYNYSTPGTVVQTKGTGSTACTTWTNATP